MGWEDRPYYRDRGTSRNPLAWVMYGSVPLFTAFGIRVRAHSSMVIYIAAVLVFGFGYKGFSFQDRLAYSTLLFGIVLLHEFGHCFTARWVGGEAEDILMHPLGGLAFARPPHRPLPTFLTVAGGPAVNVVICLLCGVVLWHQTGAIPWNPFVFYPPQDFNIHSTAGNILWYTFWVYFTSFQLLMFNLLPIFPLDGGQMLQAILWPKFGYYRAMMFACVTGMVGAVLGGLYALYWFNLGMAILAGMGFLTCFSLRRQLQAAGPYGFDGGPGDATDYSAAYDIHAGRPRRRRPALADRWAARRAAKAAREEADEQVQIDRILAKVSASGMNSLTWAEKRTLKKATEHQRERDTARRKPRNT